MNKEEESDALNYTFQGEEKSPPHDYADEDNRKIRVCVRVRMNLCAQYENAKYVSENSLGTSLLFSTGFGEKFISPIHKLSYQLVLYVQEFKFRAELKREPKNE